MGRLTTLKPRLGTLDTRKVTQQASGSWRDGKTTTERGYGYRWQKARERYLRAHPLCRYCQREDRVTAASIVDHITAHQGDDTLFWNESNWQPLCKPCHDSVKAREERSGHFKRD